MSLSTTEVKYRAVAIAAQESTWLIQLINNLHQQVDYVIPLYCDNQLAIHLAENLVFMQERNMWKCIIIFLEKKLC